MSSSSVSAKWFYDAANRIVPRMGVVIGLGLTVIWTSLLGYGVFSLIWSAI
jgi:hypothetical protein